MKHIKNLIVLVPVFVVLSMPLVSFASSVYVNATAGMDGKSSSVSSKGEDGADGASGTVITNGNSSSRVDIHTEVNGKVIEDVHSTVENNTAPYEHTQVYDDGTTHVETKTSVITGHASSSGATSTLQVKETKKAKQVETYARDVRSLFPDIFGEIYPITSQFISESTDTQRVSEARKSDAISTTVHRIFSNIFTYVTNIF